MSLLLYLVTTLIVIMAFFLVATWIIIAIALVGHDLDHSWDFFLGCDLYSCHNLFHWSRLGPLSWAHFLGRHLDCCRYLIFGCGINRFHTSVFWLWKGSLSCCFSSLKLLCCRYCFSSMQLGSRCTLFSWLRLEPLSQRSRLGSCCNFFSCSDLDHYRDLCSWLQLWFVTTSSLGFGLDNCNNFFSWSRESLSQSLEENLTVDGLGSHGLAQLLINLYRIACSIWISFFLSFIFYIFPVHFVPWSFFFFFYKMGRKKNKGIDHICKKTFKYYCRAYFQRREMDWRPSSFI